MPPQLRCGGIFLCGGGIRNMGIPKNPVAMPDVFGLPVYKVNRFVRRRVGDEIQILCGQELFGQVIWSHVSIMKAADCLIATREAAEIAIDALNDPEGLRAERH